MEPISRVSVYRPLEAGRGQPGQICPPQRRQLTPGQQMVPRSGRRATLAHDAGPRAAGALGRDPQDPIR